MTVTIQVTDEPLSLRDQADIIVARELKDRAYDSGLREAAAKCIADFYPAYVRLSDYSDQLSTMACTWAMGEKLGVSSLDPVQPLRGMRAVLDHLSTLYDGPEFVRRMGVILRNCKPINAMAELDRELLMTERGLNPHDFPHYPEKKP